MQTHDEDEPWPAPSAVPPAPAFRFALAAVVRWTIEQPPHIYRYRILGRRYWEWAGQPTLVDYQVVREGDPDSRAYVARETELELWPEEAMNNAPAE